MTNYFTDREYGSRPRTVETIDARVWGGLHAIIIARINDGSFGYRFPEHCDDGYGPCGCDLQTFQKMLVAEVPWVEWPLSPHTPPDTPVILDLLDFCAAAVGHPIQGDFHGYMRHYHMSWDRPLGLQRFVEDVNLMFARNALAFELTTVGETRRLLSQPLAEALTWTLFNTGDTECDRLLEAARNRITSPKLDVRQDALEKLWDAFERLKTLEPGADKKAQANALLDRTAQPGSKFRQMLSDEALALTNIGNAYRIRHSEITQELLTTPEQIDYLFARMFAFVRIVLKSTNRGG